MRRPELPLSMPEEVRQEAVQRWIDFEAARMQELREQRRAAEVAAALAPPSERQQSEFLDAMRYSFAAHLIKPEDIIKLSVLSIA